MDNTEVSKTTDSGKCRVNVKLIPMKIHFFLFFGSFAGLGPALILYCQKIGMSFSMIGTMYAVLPFIQFLSKPVTGSFADKYQKHKATFMASILLMTISVFSINFIPTPVDLDTNQNITWSPHNDSVFECSSVGTFNDSKAEMLLTVCETNDTVRNSHLLAHSTVLCNLSCDHSTLNEISSLYCDEDNLKCFFQIDKYSFYETNNKLDTISLLVATVPVSNNGSQSFDAVNVDGACTTLLIRNITLRNLTVTSCVRHSQIHFGCSATCTANGNKLESGKRNDLRLQFVWIWTANLVAWCAYGTLMSTSDSIVLHLLGENTDAFGMTRLYGSVGWGLMAPIIGFIIDKVSEGLPEKNYSPGFYLFVAFMMVDFLVNIPTKVNVTDKSKKLFKEVTGVFRSPEVIILTVAVLCNGVTTGFLWTFLVVYADELNGTQLIIGLNYAVECFLSEIPLFAVSGWIVAKLGHSNSMTLSLLFCGIKCLLYSLIDNAWYMLIIGLIHGVTYGLLYSSMATYISLIAPPGTIATLQGLFQGLFEGIGVGVGNLIGGFAYESLGGKKCFLIFGLVTVFVSALHFVSNCILLKLCRRPDTETVGK